MSSFDDFGGFEELADERDLECHQFTCFENHEGKKGIRRCLNVGIYEKCSNRQAFN